MTEHDQYLAEIEKDVAAMADRDRQKAQERARKSARIDPQNDQRTNGSEPPPANGLEDHGATAPALEGIGEGLGE